MTYIKNILILVVLTLTALPVLSAKERTEKEFTVVIDPGHGGKDVGATDNGVMEKNINLQVAKQLESLIKKKLKDTKVVMTRDNDKYLTLQERADKANKSQGDLFISIHTNSVDKKNRNRKNVAGSSVYTLGLHKDDNNLQVAMRENAVIELENDYEQKYSGFDPQRDESYIIFEMAQKKNLSQSIRFAESVEKELVNSGRQDRGVHQAGFWVLWATSMPAVLIELDFICNPTSAKYMSSEKGAKELATAIFKAVEKYQNSWKKLSAAGSNRDDVYSPEGSNDDYLTDSYIDYGDVETGQVAVVSSRKKKTHSPETSQKKPVGYQGRKRRNLSSREQSLRQSFEKDDLVLIASTNRGVEEINEKEIDSNIQLASNQTENLKDNKNNKKSKKKTKTKESKKTKKDKKTSDNHNAKVNKLVTVYKIQVLASEDLLNQGNERFCGLTPISTYKENNLYKYYYGESTDRSELEAMLPDVRKKIPDAFIVSSTKSVQGNKK